jgi:hypothetical protein
MFGIAVVEAFLASGALYQMRNRFKWITAKFSTVLLGHKWALRFFNPFWQRAVGKKQRQKALIWVRAKWCPGSQALFSKYFYDLGLLASGPIEGAAFRQLSEHPH